MDTLSVAALLLGGLLAGFLNVVAGGGSLLAMPLMIFLGVPETAANGSARIAILAQNVFAVARYQRAGAIDWQPLRWAAPFVLVGAAVGATIGARLADHAFRVVLGWVSLVAALVVAVDIGRWVRRAPVRFEQLRPTPGSIVVLLVIGLYGGMIQAGVGYLILAGLTLIIGLDVVAANVLKVVLVLAYTPVALGVFLAHGAVDIGAGALLATGQALGAWLGASATLRHGARLVRWGLAVAVVLAAIALLR